RTSSCRTPMTATVSPAPGPNSILSPGKSSVAGVVEGEGPVVEGTVVGETVVVGASVVEGTVDDVVVSGADVSVVSVASVASPPPQATSTIARIIVPILLSISVSSRGWDVRTPAPGSLL